jgi:hypothetical protein
VFTTALRIAADPTQPLGRRVTNLSSAIEHFWVFPYREMFALLNNATGSAPGNWTSDQVTTAVQLLRDARRSWTTHLRRVEQNAVHAKTLPGYQRVDYRDEFVEWRAQYFDAKQSALWRVDIGAWTRVWRQSEMEAKISWSRIASCRTGPVDASFPAPGPIF